MSSISHDETNEAIHDFETSLYFFARCVEHETVKPYALRYQPDDDLPRTNFVAEKRRIKVHDIRRYQASLDFEKCGFRVLSFHSSMQHDDFHDPEKIKNVYLQELRENLKRALGVSHAYVLDYVVHTCCSQSGRLLRKNRFGVPMLRFRSLQARNVTT